MKILFIGVVDFSHHCLKELIKNKENVVALFSRERSGFHSDYKDLWPLAEKARIPIYDIADINSEESLKVIKTHKPDVIFCFGWSQILNPRVLRIPPLGVIGVHPAALPQNRGRHPLIWALCLGLNRSALTFFKMNNVADGGDIISQREFPITYRDNAQSVYKKIKRLASIQIKEFVPLLKGGKIRYRRQNMKKANTWRKRGMADGKIDWRMSSRAIYDLVRALTHPYVGAHCCQGNRIVKIWKVKGQVCKQSNIEPRGVAMECRINAEDSANNFTPCAGTIEEFRPPGGPGVRFDSHVYAGYRISPYYDSCISKLSSIHSQITLYRISSRSGTIFTFMNCCPTLRCRKGY